MISFLKNALLLWRNEACVCGGHGVLDQIVRTDGNRVKDLRIWPMGDADGA
jgi:hypothetical protein